MITVFSAKQVQTMDPGRPTATAVAVRDGRIVSVGSVESMRPWLEREPHEFDNQFSDKVIFPGFIDPHTHFRISGIYMGLTYIGPIDQQGVDGELKGLSTREEVLEKLRQADSDLSKPTEPIIAWGLDPAVQGGQLDRDELDTVSQTRPIWTLTYAPHVVVANSAMLNVIGVDESTEIYGIERYDDGRLNGQFIERGATQIAFRPVASHLNEPGRGVAAIRALADTAQRAGVTTTADMLFGAFGVEKEWADYQKAVEDPSFPMRVFLVPLEGTMRSEYGENTPSALLELQKRNSDKLAFHGVKFINDGSYPAMTLRPGFPGYLDGHQGHRGPDRWESLVEVMRPYWEAGIQIHSHANGDETVQTTLDVLDALQHIKPRFDHRFTIEHYCISTPDQARRLKALGGLASVNDYFVHYRSILHAEQGYGPDRAEATARLGTLEREGVIFALHSDFSLVLAPIHPLTAAWIAVNRLAIDEKTIQAPGERVGLERALRAITIDAAHILRRDHMLGSLEAGKYADFTVLDSDPYEIDPLYLKDIQIVATVLSGRVFRND